MKNNIESIFLKYQQDYINDKSRYKIVEKSRRVGITFAEAFDAIYQRAINNRKLDYYYIAQDEKQAKQFIKDCSKFVELLQIMSEQPLVDLKNMTTTSIPFMNGSTIFAMTSSPSAIRGKGGDVCLDEFAHHEHAEELYKAARPVIQWGGSLKIISTHNGLASFFNRIVEQSKSGESQYSFSLHTIDIHRAISNGLATKVPGTHLKFLPDMDRVNQEFLAELKATSMVSDSMFQEEYECTPQSTGSSLVTATAYDKLAIAKDVFDEDWKPDPKFSYYLGMDIGKGGDLTVIWIIKLLYDHNAKYQELERCYETSNVRILKTSDLNPQTDIMRKLLRYDEIEYAFIDQGLFGTSIVEDLQYTGKVKGISFGVDAKKDMAELLSKLVTQERISFPAPEQHFSNLVRDEILCLRRIMAPTGGKAKYDGRSKYGHADAAWACALAVKCAEEMIEPYSAAS